MFNEKQEMTLQFCRDLSSQPVASMEHLVKCCKPVGAIMRCAELDIDISEDETFMPDAKTRYMTLYQAPDFTEERRSEPIHFKFNVSREGTILITIYPLDTPFTEDEKKEFETLTNITFFYFGRLRFAQVVEQSAMTQYLTGLPNSGGYMMRVGALFSQGKLKEYTAYYFNLKGFGRISNRYGQQEGNEIMRRYAGSLKEFIHPDEVIGHLGGDNFTALIKKERQADFINFLSGVEAYGIRMEKEEHFKIAATIGLWNIDDKLTDPGEVISLPSIAISIAKNVLHQAVAEISDDMLSQVAKQKDILAMFHKALENEEFHVYYQPKVDSRTNKLVGSEGLVRWFHHGEMVSPGAFIPVLEQEGEILHLDYYVLEHACADIKRWLDEGLDPVTVSVNFSRRDLSDKDLAENINKIIEESGIDRNLIQIEVTETIDEEEHGVLTEFLDKLYDMNITTAIDDFGSGYSSLSTLREFKVHTLKIDRSFINTEEFSHKDEIILTDIIHMAQELGMHVITEGVERDDQLDFVNKAGCYLIQGFYYDRPLPVEDYEKRLSEKQY